MALRRRGSRTLDSHVSEAGGRVKKNSPFPNGFLQQHWSIFRADIRGLTMIIEIGTRDHTGVSFRLLSCFVILSVDLYLNNKSSYAFGSAELEQRSSPAAPLRSTSSK
jgi:hypothetical protein